jgi:hypothetical protein
MYLVEHKKKRPVRSHPSSEMLLDLAEHTHALFAEQVSRLLLGPFPKWHGPLD